jgi:hypothetical protein
VTTRKPKWNCTDERQWLAWVNEQLDILEYAAEAEDESPLSSANLKLFAALPSAVFHEIGAVSRAKARWRLYGEVEPLRKRFPEIAEVIRPPPDWRQQRRLQARADKRMLLRLTIEDVHRIRKLWRDHYGRWKRGRLGPTAVRLAALRNRVDVTELEEAIRRRGKAWLEAGAKNHPK